MRRIAAVVMTSASLLVSCIGLEEGNNEAVGYLAAPSLEVDVTVDDLLLTKALDFEVAEPSSDQIHFIVKDRGGNVKYEGNGLWSEPLVLPVGSYTIEATAGTNGFGAPYFEGSASGTVEALDREVPELTMALANSLVRVTIDSSLEGHFTPGATVSFNEGAYTADYAQWTYVPSGAVLYLSLAGTNSAGLEAVYTHQLSEPSAKVAYDVVCGAETVDWPSITLADSDGAFEGGLYFNPAEVANMSEANVAKLKYQLKVGDGEWSDVEVSDVVDTDYKYISGLVDGTAYSLRAYVGSIYSNEIEFSPVSFDDCFTCTQVTAAHNNANDATVELTGTTMTASGMKVTLPAIVAELAEVTVAGSFSSENNDATGQFSGALSSEASDMSFTNADTWPYLPQGNYTATVTATCSLDGTVITATRQSDVLVSAPDFSLTVSAYTSYDKYAQTNGITKDISGANSCDPTTLYNAGAAWGISTAIMANENYAKTLAIKIDDDASRTFNVAGEYVDNKYYENVANLSWSSHSLTVSFTFDGTTKSKEQTHHITGLPYTAAPPKNSGDHPWIDSKGNNTWNSDCVQLYYSAATYPRIISPTFNIPQDINVDVSTKIYREYYWSSVARGPIKVYQYNSTSGSEKSIYDARLSREETLETTWPITMSSTYNAYYIEYAYAAATGKTNVYYFNVYYR